MKIDLNKKIGGHVWNAGDLIDIINQEYSINQNDLNKVLNYLDQYDLDYNGYKNDELIIDILFNYDFKGVRNIMYF